MDDASRAAAAANTIAALVESDFPESLEARVLLGDARIAAKQIDKASELAAYVLLAIMHSARLAWREIFRSWALVFWPQSSHCFNRPISQIALVSPHPIPRVHPPAT